MKRIPWPETLLVLLVCCVCLAGACTLPTEQCPDEKGRMLLIDWMCAHNSLPTGDEAETILPQWGFSYALVPYLNAMIGAFFMKAGSLVCREPWFLRMAARLGSVLSVTGCCVFCLLLGRRLFEKRSSAFLLAAFVCCLPQVLFLGMYHNNDSLSLLAVCMTLYFVARGADDHFSGSSCVGLGVSMAVGLLSYYNIYGWLLLCAVFCILFVRKDPAISSKFPFILRRAAWIAGLCLLLAGWFFLRNALLHEGDFLGLASETRSREAQCALGKEVIGYNSFRDKGYSLIGFLRYRDYEWLRLTSQSFVGVTGHMLFYLPLSQYGVYYALIWLGLLLFAAVALRGGLSEKNRLFTGLLLSGSLITLLLSLFQSYIRDYQPQGRYVITLALVFGFLLAQGADGVTLRTNAARKGRDAVPVSAALAGIWLLLAARSLYYLLTPILP